MLRKYAGGEKFGAKCRGEEEVKDRDENGKE